MADQRPPDPGHLGGPRPVPGPGTPGFRPGVVGGGAPMGRGAYDVAGTLAALHPPRTTHRYTTTARSPLWFLLGSWLCLAGAFAVFVAWAGWSDPFDDQAGVDVAVLVVPVLLLIAGSVLGLLCLRQIGVNAGRYGVWLVLFAGIQWEGLAYAGRDRAESLEAYQLRTVVALLVGTLLLATVRRAYVTKLWLAGPLPAPGLSHLLWLPSLVVSVILNVALAVQAFGAQQVTTATYTAWRVEPVPAGVIVLYVGVQILVGLGMLVTTLSAIIVQHVGIGRERRERAHHEAWAAVGGPAAPPFS